MRFDKDTLYTHPVYAAQMADLLSLGIRIINANYKYLEEVGLNNPMQSGANAIDYIKELYPEDNIILGGVSAGAGISLYHGLKRNDIDGIIALEMQDLNVHQWEEVFPDLNVEQTLRIKAFADLYTLFYGDSNPTDWSLQPLLGNGTPIYVLNTVDRPFNLLDTDNLYHNIRHAEVFARAAQSAGHPITTAPQSISIFAEAIVQ